MHAVQLVSTMNGGRKQAKHACGTSAPLVLTPPQTEEQSKATQPNPSTQRRTKQMSCHANTTRCNAKKKAPYEQEAGCGGDDSNSIQSNQIQRGRAGLGGVDRSQSPNNSEKKLYIYCIRPEFHHQFRPASAPDLASIVEELGTLPL